MVTAKTSLPVYASVSDIPAALISQHGRRFMVCYTALQVLVDLISIDGGILLAHRFCLLLGIVEAASVSFRHNLQFSAFLLALLTLAVFRHLGLYQHTSSILNIRETENIVRGLGLLVLGTIVTLYFYHVRTPLLLIAITALTVLILLLVERGLLFTFLRWAHSKGYGAQRLLIYGEELGEQIFKKIAQSPRLGMCCAGLIVDDPSLKGVTIMEQSFSKKRRTTVLGTWNELADIVARNPVDEIIIAQRSLEHEQFTRIMADCERIGIPVSFVPNVFGLYHHCFNFYDIDGVPLARLRRIRISAAQLLTKRVFDLVFSGLLLVLCAPFFALMAILIRIDSSGPAVFRQLRVGRGGKPFELYKFRTMWTGAAHYQESPNSSADPRITRLGRWLRRTSLDELPQLWNVLKGEMSLVGPRPEMPFIVDTYSTLARQRLRVKPGITGLWQISADRALPIHENLEYDLYYIENRTFLLDCVILLYTLIFAIRGKGAC